MHRFAPTRVRATRLILFLRFLCYQTGGAAELSVVVATQNGRTTTNRRASFEVHGSDADNFGRLAARIFKKRRVETTSKNPVPEEWQNEESVADPENEQPALPLAKVRSRLRRSGF